jgi:uncharacterized protein
MKAAREPVIDALRALALVGVLVVNLYGYPVAPERFAVLQADPTATTADRVLDGLVGALLLAKAYPVLTFLFGYSLVLGERRGAHSRKRLKRLAALGALHGALLYFGDILLPYAIAGWWATRRLRQRWSSLKRELIAWGLVSVVLTLGLALMSGAAAGEADSPAPTTFASVNGASAWALLNLQTWLVALFSTVLMLPQLMVLMLLGVAAGRLRLLTHPRWRAQLLRTARAVLPWAVAANVAWALCLVLPATQYMGWYHWLSSLTWPLGPIMGLAAMAYAAARWQGLRTTALLGLAALGRRTLTLYLAHSLVAVLLLSGAALALPLGRIGLLLLALGLWIMGWWWAQWAERRGSRGPAEAWMARA